MSHFYPVIHPTAIIHPKARLDATVRVGPYAVIDEGVELGADCVSGRTFISRDRRRSARTINFTPAVSSATRRRI
jgi:UDP-3-O-[3-hydroxymyristoyl] glucosamine N-acyltransferase